MSDYRVIIGQRGKLAWMVYALGVLLAGTVGYGVGSSLGAEGDAERIQRWCPVAVRSLARDGQIEQTLATMDATARARLSRLNSGSYALVAALLLLPLPGFAMRRRCGGSGTCPDCSCDRGKHDH